MNKTEGQMLTELFMRDMITESKIKCCLLVYKCKTVNKQTSKPLEQTARYWVGQSNQEYTQGKGSGKRFCLTLDQGHEGSLREELQKDSRSSMYKDIAMWLSGLNVLSVCCRNYSAMPLSRIIKCSIDYYCSHCHGYLQHIIVSYYWINRSIDYDRSHCNDCHMMRHLLCIIELSAILIVVYFQRLKIIHESHEFLLKSDTVANSTYR